MPPYRNTVQPRGGNSYTKSASTMGTDGQFSVPLIYGINNTVWGPRAGIIIISIII